ncbi:hypothetical protein JKP88DRAFT_242606 [Tribonema minus]|uniref:Uncharacterized protein n=1 Tax=Tribonema minus TaxID=303371 RepID=A0A835ZPU8_9STRA|nr:hypothetical protein JKP88DRAFT_242606 [Tribonema minus]
MAAAAAGDRMGDSQRSSGSGASAATSNLKFKATWMDDKDSEVCLLCDQAFTFTNRRHHCRSCFKLVCSSCSGQQFGALRFAAAAHCTTHCAVVRNVIRSYLQRYCTVNEHPEERLLLCSVLRCTALYCPQQQYELGVQQLPHTMHPCTLYCTVLYCNHCPACSKYELGVQQSRSGRVAKQRVCDECHASLEATKEVDTGLCDPRTIDPTQQMQVGKTRSIESTAPQWGEMFAFRVRLTCRVADYVVVQVFDKRSRVNSDDLLGHCRVPLYTMAENSRASQWHRLYHPTAMGITEGRVHIVVERGRGGPLVRHALRCALPMASPVVPLSPGKRCRGGDQHLENAAVAASTARTVHCHITEQQHDRSSNSEMSSCSTAHRTGGGGGGGTAVGRFNAAAHSSRVKSSIAAGTQLSTADGQAYRTVPQSSGRQRCENFVKQHIAQSLHLPPSLHAQFGWTKSPRPPPSFGHLLAESSHHIHLTVPSWGTCTPPTVKNDCYSVTADCHRAPSAPAAFAVRLDEIYPPGHPVHRRLFLRVRPGTSRDAFVPCNERLLEAS